ncbi:MAG TPA: hypothetical protein VF299_11645 [Mycobacterium sp.]
MPGCAATLVAGALAIALTASQTSVLSGPSATPARALEVLLASSGSLQSAIGQLTDAAQQITATNSDYPFVTPYDLTLLPQYIRSTASAGLSFELNGQNLASGYDLNAGYIPQPWNAPATDPQGVGNTINPDELYLLENIGTQPQVITVNPGPGTQDMTFTPMSGNGLTQDFEALRAYDLSQFTPNANGTYTIDLSSTPQSGNWVDTAGAQTLITRDTLGDWGLPHNEISVETQGAPSTYTLPVLSNGQISSMLSDLAKAMVYENGEPTNHGLQALEDTIPANTFLPISTTLGHIAGGPILPGQLATFGHFDLAADQALIVKVPTIDAAYSAFEVNNAWAITSPFVTAPGGLNDTDTLQDPSGFTYYVISAQDPGVANWISDSGATDGDVMLRWQDPTGVIPTTPIQTEVVNVADVRSDLPADTPVVTAAERAAELQERLFDYDYRTDQLLGPGWVTSNLELDQVKDAVGVAQFDKIFGGQTDVPSVLDRMTESTLMPNLSTLGHDISANPQDSLSAVMQNVPLLVKDIDMPIILAELRMDMIIGQTFQTIDSDVSSGQLSQAMSTLQTGVQQLGTAAGQMWTDPATSISAGILNARDDLATSIMNAGSYSPLSSSDLTSVASQLSQFDQSASQMLSGGLSYLTDLGAATTASSGADAASLGADAAAAGLSADLLP